jgi:hypothetical protein
MGWWKIDNVEHGQADPSLSAMRGYGLAAAMPGIDHAENYYNGDGPADICSVWLREIMGALYRNDIRPTRAMMQALWMDESTSLLTDRIRQALKQGTKIAKDQVDKLYRTTWGRPPYEEELLAIFNFIANPAFRGSG